jgi:hypothetical protein
MEGLIELVAASFTRHGIESPAADPKAAELTAAQPFHAAPAMSQIEPSALPEHSYRKKPDGDFAI